MNLFDALLLLVFVLSLWAGWRRGFVAAGAELIALVACFAFTLAVYPQAAVALARWRDFGVWALPLAFSASFVAAWVVLGLLLRTLMRRVPQAAQQHRANRALGLLPGAGNGLIQATVLAAVLLAVPFDGEFSRQARDSRVANRLAVPAEWVEAQIAPVFDPALARTLHRLTVQPSSTESVQLPFKTTTGRERPDLEAQMLVLVNEERRKAGVTPLRADTEATPVARAHARDMLARGYFAHVTPDGQTPTDRMRAGGLRFLAAGENLALSRTLPMAHEGLMNSPGHRANILRPTFGRVGIGIIDAGRHGLMVTQTFRN